MNAPNDEFFRHAGDLRGDYEQVAWERTPLGPPSSWPGSLRATLSLCLSSILPSVIAWGAELTLLYNAPFASMIGEKHPRALGASHPTIFWENWGEVGPMLHQVMRTGLGASYPDILHPMQRNGVMEDCYFTYGRSPLRDETGAVKGVYSVVLDVTQARRTQNELRASEERLRAVIEHSRDGINLLDLKTQRYVLVSSALAASTGFTAEELRNLSLEHVRDRVHPDDRQRFDVHHDQVISGKDEAQPVEYRAKVKSGDYRWFSVTHRLIRHEQGHPESLVGVSRDITERKRDEERNRFHAGLLNRVSDAVVSTDARFCITSWNKGAEAIYGWTEEEALGREVDGLLRTDFPAARRDHALATLKQHGQFRGDVVHRDKQGRRVHIQSNLVTLVSPDGQVDGTLGVLRDVTEFRAIEKALKESDERLRQVLEAIYIFVGVLTPDGVMVECNSAPLRAARQRREDVIGTPFADTYWWGYSEDSRQRIRADIERARRGEAVRYDASVRLKDAEGRPMQVDIDFALTPLRNAAGEVTHLISIGVDISDRNRTKEALREADRNKAQFLAMLSHELRNPLAPIRNSLHILNRVAPDGEAAARAKKIIQRQTDHMSKLVDDLLDVTRISEGKIQLQRDELDAGEVVSGTVEDYKLTFDAAEIRLHFTPPTDALPVNGDRTRIAQAVGNLLHNAHKFTPRDGTVTVTVERDAARGEVVIVVADTGAGIAHDVQGKLFQPFYQADRTLDRSQGGLGLGLSMVRGFAELHGGSVSVQSEGPGRGSAFSLRLPLMSQRVARVGGAPAGEGLRGRRRILIVEDNIDSADSLKELLELSGHQVLIAHDGHEAIKTARAFQPEIVLCDIGLPEMDGYEVARALRADSMVRHASLVALSGYAMPEDLQRAVAAGFDLHIAKPVKFEVLEKLVMELGSNR